MGKVGIIMGTGWSDVPYERDGVVAVKRIHMNQDPEGVRWQVESLIRQGCEKLILTAAVGSLSLNILPGDIVLIDGFVSVYAPALPLQHGEFVSPDDVIDMEALEKLAFRIPTDLKYWIGGHVMVRGPNFEGRKYDKALLRKSGASVVGMSILPEAAIAAVHGIRILPITFVTNSAVEIHSHEENVRRVKECTRSLTKLLDNALECL